MNAVLALIAVACAGLFAQNANPIAVSVSPAANNAAARQQFTWVASDANGAGDVAVMYTFVSVPVNSSNVCYVIISAASETWTLVDNNGNIGGWFPFATTDTAENSQCKVYASGSRLTRSGNTITAVVDIEFKPTYTGRKNLWMMVQDSSGATSHTEDLGDFSPLFPRTYYVDPAGNDTHNGLSPASAWRTLAHVNGQSFECGDRILLKRDAVWREQLKPPSSGCAGQSGEITFGAYGAGVNKPQLRGDSVITNRATTGWTQDGTKPRWYRAWNFKSNVVWQDGLPMLRRKDNMSWTPDEAQFYYDSASSRLYIQTSTGASPAGFLIEANTVNPDWQGLVDVRNKEYVVVEGLWLYRSNWYSYYSAEGGFNTFRSSLVEWGFHNTIGAVGWPGERDTVGITFNDNVLNNNGLGRHGPVDVNESENVGVNALGWIGNGVPCSGGTIARNIVTNQGGEGIQILAGSTDVCVHDNKVVNAADISVYVSSGWGNSNRNGGKVQRAKVWGNYVEAGPRTNAYLYSIAGEQVGLIMSAVNPPDDSISFSSPHHQTTGTLAYVFNYLGNGNLPGGLQNGTSYYLCVIDSDTIKLSSSQAQPCNADTVVNITSAGSTNVNQVGIGYDIEDVDFHHNVGVGYNSDSAALGLGSGGYLAPSVYGPPCYVKNVRVHHNTFVGIGTGIKILGPVKDKSNVISNNIIKVRDYGLPYWVVPPVAPYAGANPLSYYNIDRDNIFKTAGSEIVYTGDPATGFTAYTLSGWRAAFPLQGQNSVVANPLFLDEAARDYRLTSQSPARDIGAAVPGIDQVRYGTAPDAGAYEYAPGKLGSSHGSKLRNRHKPSASR